MALLVKSLAFVSTLGTTEPCAFKVKEALEAQTPLHVSPHHIDDPEFGAALVAIVQGWLR